MNAGRRPTDGTLAAAFEAALAQRATGMLVLPDEPFFVVRRGEIVALAAQHRMPAFHGLRANEVIQ